MVILIVFWLILKKNEYSGKLLLNLYIATLGRNSQIRMKGIIKYHPLSILASLKNPEDMSLPCHAGPGTFDVVRASRRAPFTSSRVKLPLEGFVFVCVCVLCFAEAGFIIVGGVVLYFPCLFLNQGCQKYILLKICSFIYVIKTTFIEV